MKCRTWSDIIGHANLLNWLKARIEADTVPNVIIFHGNAGLGKTSIAKLLSVHTAFRNSSKSELDSALTAVIDNNQNIPSVISFNMSVIKENEEEIKRVVSEMNTTFSPTGRKCLILDEAHGMSRKAQDAILVELEALPSNVYVFMCTTEITTLRETLVSRSKATLRLSDLSLKECKVLITRELSTRNLTLPMSDNMIISVISAWAGNQPRKIINLFESIGENRAVSRSELELFINTTSISSVIELVKHLYESVVMGIDMLQNMEVDDSFINALIEVCKVSLGSTSSIVSSNDAIYIKDYFSHRDPNKLLQFTIELSSKRTFSHNQVISAFMRAGFNNPQPPTSHERSQVAYNDMQNVDNNIKATDLLKSVTRENNVGVPSLNELFSNSERIK